MGRRKLVALLERRILGVGMALILFVLERRLKQMQARQSAPRPDTGDGRAA